MIPVPLDYCMEISAPARESLWPTKVFKGCLFWIDGQVMEAYLILLDLKGFDVILGMNWLMVNYPIVDCFKNEVIFRQLGFSKAVFYRKQKVHPQV